ncbi:MAG: hypothetical protein AAGI07_15580, partial [Bacteroidota bacterium]
MFLYKIYPSKRRNTIASIKPNNVFDEFDILKKTINIFLAEVFSEKAILYTLGNGIPLANMKPALLIQQ